MSASRSTPQSFCRRRKPPESGGSEAFLARAEAIVERLSAEYPTYAARDLDLMERAAALFLADRPAQEPHYDEIARIAHDIRGQGTVFGYPLMTRLAGSLCLALRSLEPRDGAMATIIRSHIFAMRTLIGQGITGAGNRPAQAIAVALELLVRSRTDR